MSSSYRPDYAELELPEEADWPAARATYRRLVNRWHPDRYAEKPRERAHAQARFIRITRSFDRLRQYHREHERLPFQTVTIDDPDTLQARRRSEAVADERRRDALSDAVSPAQAVSGFEPRSSRQAAKSRPRRSLLFGGLAVLLLIGTLVVVLVLDQNQSRRAFEAGREALRATPPSEFMPSSTEVRRQSTRGTFVEREDGKLGDQLMPDMFR